MSRRLTLHELAERQQSKYALVAAAAKRGRALMDGEPPLLEPHASKPVTIALEEIRNHKLIVEIPPVGIK